MAIAAIDHDCLSFGDFHIDRGDERLIGPNGPIRLGNKAFRVLLLLAENEGRLLTKDALFSSVWDGTIVSESALTSVVKELRRALGDEARPPRFIESVYGRGYRFLPEVKSAAKPAEALAAPTGTAPATARGAAPIAPAKPPLLYVPVFDDSAVRDSQPHLAAVLREEMLLALSRFRDLRLVSRASGGESADAAYGKRDYQLTVRLIPGGATVRAFARLSRLDSGGIIWADQIELAVDSPGGDVDRLVRGMVSAALPRLQDDLLGNLPPQPEDVYGQYCLLKLSMRRQPSFAEAREIAAGWERMIAEHPGFAQAYPPLTRLYNTDYGYSGIGSTGEAERQRAYDLAHSAFALDPGEAHLHAVKGWAHLWVGETALAREHLDEALRLNPYNQNRLVEVTKAFLYLEDLDRAEELLDRCRELTPFATEAPNEEQGLLHLLRGEFAQAAKDLALVRRHHPDEMAGTEPAIMSELYALLAAAGSRAPDLAQRYRRWHESMSGRWCAAEPLDAPRLKQWVLFHNPFRSDARRQWIVELVETAMRA